MKLKKKNNSVFVHFLMLSSVYILHLQIWKTLLHKVTFLKIMLLYMIAFCGNPFVPKLSNGIFRMQKRRVQREELCK